VDDLHDVPEVLDGLDVRDREAVLRKQRRVELPTLGREAQLAVLTHQKEALLGLPECFWQFHSLVVQTVLFLTASMPPSILGFVVAASGHQRDFNISYFQFISIV